MTKLHSLFGTLMVLIMALPQANADEPASPAVEVSSVFLQILFQLELLQVEP